MDRNLGATRVATSSNDSESYGGLYQWGRRTDGHEIRTSSETNTISTNDTPGDSFIVTSTGDWRSTLNNSLWQGINGINNPCPSGYRIPTQSEWQDEFATWTSMDEIGAFSSRLKLPLGGYRVGFKDGGFAGDVFFDGSRGNYWTSTIDGGPNAIRLYLGVAPNEPTSFGGFFRFDGLSVRCIKNKQI
jgi:uncharacterized protein (TIGR02145 family)